MVWPLKAHERKTPDICDTGKLGDSLLRVLLPGPRQQAGAPDIHPSTTEDHAGGNNHVRLCRIYLLCNERKLTLNYLWASLCMVGAVFFIFRPN